MLKCELVSKSEPGRRKTPSYFNFFQLNLTRLGAKASLKESREKQAMIAHI